MTVEDIKKVVMKDFGLEDPHTLFKVDAFEEPTMALRRGKLTLAKYSVTTGDLLILKSDKD